MNCSVLTGSYRRRCADHGYGCVIRVAHGCGCAAHGCGYGCGFSAEHGAGYLQSAACTATANTDASALHRDTRSSSSSGIRTGRKLAA